MLFALLTSRNRMIASKSQSTPSEGVSLSLHPVHWDLLGQSAAGAPEYSFESTSESVCALYHGLNVD